jgi:predicted GNAT family N-acyltransferase
MSKKERKENKDEYCGKGYAHFLAIEKGNVISSVELFKRNIRYKGKNISLGGLGGVCTTKKRRNRGIATLLMKKGMDDFKKQKFDIAFLGTNIKNPKLVRLYNNIGFVVMKQPRVSTGKSGKRYVEKDGMIAPIKSRSKLNLILKSKEILDIGLGGI